MVGNAHFAPPDSKAQLIVKTSRLLLLTALLAGSISLLTAGPGPQFWVRPAAPKSAPTAVVTSANHPTAVANATCANCACCKKA